MNIGQLLDLTTPWCLLTAATLRIPELVAAGHTEIDDLAVAAGCDRDALHAVLGHLVSKGVFTEDPPGRFACNEAAEELGSAPFLDLEGMGGRMAYTWSTLPGYVRTGQPSYDKVFGLPFWEDLAAHPLIAAEFDELMGPAGHGVPDYEIELNDGWDSVRTVVDVGGGTGSMLLSLLDRHPGARGILVDLPGTVARAEIDDPRVAVSGQSFFDPLPAGGDLYLLKKVLNDWPDEPTVAILRRCAEALAPGGRVVVLGGVAPDDARRTLGIDMLVAGGKTSTLTEFSELAGRAGLRVRVAGTQPSGQYVVECSAKLPAAEGHVGDAAGADDRLHLEAVLQALQAVPEALAAPEEDRHDDDVHVVDEVHVKELTHHRHAASDAHVQPASGVPGEFERPTRHRVDEVEGGAARQLDRRPGVVGEHVHGGMERRFRSPPPLPLLICPLASLRPELVAAHDLGPDAGSPLPRERVVDAGASAGLAVHLMERAGSEEPAHQPVRRVPEGRLQALLSAGAVAVQRDSEVVNPDS
jgi:2,7-dihydroxy-5-methyl-1-naphthoate 7-O-methyltransferase